MLPTIMKSNAIRVLAILALVAIPAFASPIYVNNFSFEDGSFVGGVSCGGTGCLKFTGAVPNWTQTGGGTVGRLQPGSDGTKFSSSTPSDGITQAFIVNDVLSQTVATTAVAGVMYSLMVDIGDRFDRPFLGTAVLLINGVAHPVSGPVPAAGTFGTFTVQYLAQSSDAGQAITIQLKSTGDQGNFDNVRLYQGAVPEPASFLLIGSALLGLSALRRRRPNV